MTKIAVSRPLPAELSLPGAEIKIGPRKGFGSADELYDFARGADAYVSWFTDPIDDSFLDAVGEQMRIVANFAVGYDNIDVPACSKRGVIVTNTPDAVTEGTADMAICLMLATARRLAHADRFARTEEWVRHGPLGPDEFIGQPLSERTLFIVGAGRIGYATALRTIGWGMKIIYHARNRKHVFEGAPLNGRYVSLEEGMAEADYISIHAPLNDETRHMIGARELALVKPNAIIVNTARGPVVDEEALAQALEEGRMFGAGLDVFENEPEIHPTLRKLESVVLAPHIGSANESSRTAMVEVCRANLHAVLVEGKPAVTPVGGRDGR
jgi:glyoxylate reductase